MKSAHSAGATGLHKLTPSTLGTRLKCRQEISYGVSRTRILGAFNRAAHHLGISAQVQLLMQKLVDKTYPHDWTDLSRPIVWASNDEIGNCLQIGLTQTKAILRTAAELGLIMPGGTPGAASPNGKRWGRRDKTGVIVEAYGLDLTPMLARFDEFMAIAKRGEDEMRERRRLQKLATTSLREIASAVDLAVAYAAPGDWSDQVAQATRQRDRIRRMASTAPIERLRAETAAFAQHAKDLESLVFAALPKPENRPQEVGIPTSHTALTHHPLVREVTADAGPPRGEPALSNPRRRTNEPLSKTQLPPKMTPVEVVETLPHLTDYRNDVTPTSWEEIGLAGGRLAGETGIHDAIWYRAVDALGPVGASIALALLRRRQDLRNPNAYLRGMLNKHAAGELRLDLSLLKLQRMDAAIRRGA